MFNESLFYKTLQDFFINNNKETFLQLLAEFYNRTEDVITEQNIQSELIKELRELYEKLNEKGIDKNILKDKIDLFLENNQILQKIESLENDTNNNTSQLENIMNKKRNFKCGVNINCPNETWALKTKEILLNDIDKFINLNANLFLLQIKFTYSDYRFTSDTTLSTVNSIYDLLNQCNDCEIGLKIHISGLTSLSDKTKFFNNYFDSMTNLLCMDLDRVEITSNKNINIDVELRRKNN